MLGGAATACRQQEGPDDCCLVPMTAPGRKDLTGAHDTGRAAVNTAGPPFDVETQGNLCALRGNK